jgi:hypothetical protein
MAKRPPKPASPSAALPGSGSTAPGPRIFEAVRLSTGGVKKGAPLSQSQAQARRKAGHDVVVCGADLKGNRRLAGVIERGANGNAKRCPPHPSAGPKALPHYQPDPRPPGGHTFYETPNRKAL